MSPGVIRRNYPPLKPDHPLVRSASRCPICASPFAAGDVTTMVNLGPTPTDREALRCARDGEAYNSRALVVHSDCQPPGAENA